MASSKSRLGWIIAIALLLGCFNIYQWYTNTNLKKQNTDKQIELKQIQEAEAELQKEYELALESIENLRDDNQNLNDLIDNQKKDLKAQKTKISNLIWTSRELDKAKEEIQTLNTLTSQYIADINTLKADNERLTASNRVLTEEKEILTLTLEEEKQTTSELSEAKAILASQNEELEDTKSKLSSMVDMGSAIKINWLEVQGYQLKDDGKLKKKSKAKDINVLRIKYKTETNMVTSSGDETFYVRYIDPTGETLAIEDLGSGVITNKLNDEEVRYSAEGNLEYNNEDAEGHIDWQLNFKPMKGIYAVELYNKGYLVGKGDFKLK